MTLPTTNKPSGPATPKITTRTDSQIKPENGISPLSIRRADSGLDDAIKVLIYGDTGSGKTRTILGLLRLGLRVLYFSTELGGSGLLTVKMEATPEELANLYEINGIGDYQVLTKFLRRPEEVLPDIYDLAPDVLFWDGFSEAQMVFLEEYIGEQIHAKNERDESDARRSGLFLEQRDWTGVLNGTVRMAKDFLLMRDTRTGRTWHKIATCKESEKERIDDPTGADSKPKYKAKNTMLIHGAAKKLIEGGFDLIVRCRIKSSALKPSEREFVYCTAASEAQTAKTRGIALPAEMSADFGMVWSQIRAAMEQKKTGGKKCP